MKTEIINKVNNLREIGYTDWQIIDELSKGYKREDVLDAVADKMPLWITAIIVAVISAVLWYGLSKLVA